MAAVQEALPADRDPRAREGEDDHRREVRAQPRIRPDLDARTLGDGDVDSAREPLRVDPGADHETAARSQREVRGHEVRARIRRHLETQMAALSRLEAQPVTRSPGITRMRKRRMRPDSWAVTTWPFSRVI